jgi:1-acyl-sn-glycerol-3-phosphate acyltransferase
VNPAHHTSSHTAPPRSDRVRHPRRPVLHSLRPVARALARRRLAVRVHGTEHVPRTGPMILACNHVGVRGGLGRLLRASGQIPLGRFHLGAAHLAMVTGAPVVRVVVLGSREPGGHTDSLPPPGGAVDLAFGAPYRTAARARPRTQEQVGHVSMLLRGHLLAHLDHACASTGRELPGPLPASEVEADPATGVTEQGAS